MDRKKVYDLINNEREYQDYKWRDRDAVSIATEILIMQEHLDKAKKNHISLNFNGRLALDQIRKIVAVGVRCLETHGGEDMLKNIRR
jgi:hypothetical protein